MSIKTTLITNNSIGNFEAHKCAYCNREILISVGETLYYNRHYGYRVYIHKDCIKITPPTISKPIIYNGYSEELLNDLEEKSNINILLMYSNNNAKRASLHMRRKLKKLGYIDKSGLITDKGIELIKR